MDVHIQVLGGFEVTVDGSAVDRAAWTRRHAALLVQLLALAPGRRLHREQVLDALWPDVPSIADAAPRLHKAAHYARRALGELSVVLAGESVQLWPEADVTLDAAVFEAAGAAALAAQDAEAAGLAANLYSGDLLPASPYEAWTEEPRERLRHIYLDLLRLSARWVELAQAEPTSERAHLELARSAALSGDPSGAVRWLERLERAMRRELGIGPSQSVADLRARLLAEARQRVPEVAVPEPSEHAPLGREQEFARVERLLTDVVNGHGQAVFVAGPRGIGTSTQLAQLERQALARGMRVGVGAAALLDAAWPYAPVLEALSDLCRRHPALLDGLEDAARDELRRALSGNEFDWDGKNSHQRLYVAAAELLRLAAAGPGAVLVIDDIDEADEASAHLAHYLTRATAGESVLVAVSVGAELPERLERMRATLQARDQATTLTLPPLSDAAAIALVRRYVSDDTLAETIVQASGGIPLDLEVSARAAAAGADDPTGALLPFEAGSPLGQVLEVAALLGASFTVEEVAAVLDWDDDDVCELVDEAIFRGLVVREPTGPEFRHPFVRESVIRRTPDARRRERHARTAQVIADAGGSAARVAHHWIQAGRPEEAVSWALRAAETDAALGAYRDALDALEPVAAAATGQDLVRLASLRADLLAALASPDALDAYREVLGIVEEPADVSRARVKLAKAAVFAGDLDTARIALAGLEPGGDSQRDDAEMLVVQGHLHLFSGELDEARAKADRARQSIAITPHASFAAFELLTLDGLLAHFQGEWFHRLLAELQRGAEQPKIATSLFDSHLCVAEYLLYDPTPTEEIRALAGTLRETAERSGVLRAVAFATALSGEAALLAGDLKTAERELAEAVELHHETGATAGEAHSLQRLAETALAMGDRERALQLLRRALPIARWSMIPGCLLPRLYGTRIEAAPDPESAVVQAEQADAVLGVEDRCAFCTLSFEIPATRAFAAAGDLYGARRHLAAAEVAAARWNSIGWDAAVLEARGAVAAAEGDLATASELRRRAEAMFLESGQVLDARRCAGHAQAAAG